MKKLLSKLSILLLIIITFTACSTKSLPEKFDKEKVKASAENVITLFSNEEFEKITNDFTREDLKTGLSPDVLKNAKEQVMPNAGSFVEFKMSSFVAQKDKSGTDFVSAVIAVKYQNQTVTYTISFDENNKIIGFYLK